MFSYNYTEFVCKLISQWNTNFVIPTRSLDCNDDAHLNAFQNCIAQNETPRQQDLLIVNDISLPLDEIYNKQDI